MGMVQCKLLLTFPRPRQLKRIALTPSFINGCWQSRTHESGCLSLLIELGLLITGGGSGIGFEIAIQYGLHGAKVAISGCRRHVLDSAVETLGSLSIKAIAVEGNVRKKEDARRVVETVVNELGKLDILINGAASSFLVAAEGLSPNGFKTVMDIDAVGTFTMCQETVNYLKKGGKGKGPIEEGVIINISATLHYTANWYQIHVSAALRQQLTVLQEV